MRVIKFSLYYVGLRWNVMTGKYQTPNPISLKWRWRYWKLDLHKHNDSQVELRGLAKSDEKET